MGTPPGRDRPVREGAPPALSGRLAAVSLFDVCQFLMLNRKTGTLTARNGGSAVYLTFFEGQLCTALDDSLREGTEVVFRVVQWKEGSFEFAPGPVSSESKMDSSTENILLDAARRLDEMQAEARARGAGDAAGSAEQAFREKQARAASIAEAFRSVVAEGDRDRTSNGWREAVMARLLEPPVERLVLSAEGRAGLVIGRRFEEIPEAVPGEVDAWMEQLAPVHARAPGKAGRASPGPPEARPGPDGLWGLRVEAVDGDLVFVTRTRTVWPGTEALLLAPEELDALDAIPGGLVAVLGSAGAAASRWPAWEAAAAWLARRAQSGSASGWVVEEMPRYDWTTLPGRWRRIPPARLRRPGTLEHLVRTSRPSVLAFDGLPSSDLLEDVARLAAAGMLVLVVDAAAQASAWLAAAERRGPGAGERTDPRFVATLVIGAETGSAGSGRLRARLVLPARVTPATPTALPRVP